jgi:hypothetical protein
MDYFLFSPENWMPELSYCRLHAATFYFASLITGLEENTTERIVEALGPESGFVEALIDETNASDDDAVKTAIREVIGVTVEDVEHGYEILYERRHDFVVLVGEYAAALEALSLPRSRSDSVLRADEEIVTVAEEDDLDLFEVEFDRTR